MFDFVINLFDTTDFPARWTCGNWSAAHGWTHILADTAIFGAYAAIPISIAFFVHKRKDVEFPPLWWLFAGFIAACGVGHLVEATIFFQPWYRFSGVIKVCTALVSWATVLVMIKYLPTALALPGISRLNDQLKSEIEERKKAEAERRQVESKMLETQKLESLGVLAGGIAHDFNNLLTGVLGNVSLARLGIPEHSSLGPYLDQIEKASIRAADLCKEMLAYSGRGRFVLDSVDVSKLVNETNYLLQTTICKQAVLRLNLASGIPRVLADKTQLGQIIMNLVINASEAIGGKSGIISITTGVMRADLKYLASTVAPAHLKAGDYVFVEVSDTGCGMSPEVLPRIFDPFFSTKFTGRGLGLAAVLGIVRGHEGALKVYSEPGKGTTFKVLLPCAEGEAGKDIPPDQLQDMWRGKGNVLVVDDEETVRVVSARMLESMGFQVLLAEDGREGVELYRTQAAGIVCVFLDLTMPHLDGHQTFRELRRINPQVRVVLMSGFNEEEATAHFAGRGLAGFLNKPFRIEAMRERLKAIWEA